MICALALPHHYHIQHQARINASTERVTPWLFDLQQWPTLMSWHQYITIETVQVSKPSTGITAHSYIKHNWGEIEISIHQVNSTSLTFNVLFNHEHNASGEISLNQDNESLIISSRLTGSVNNYFLGGFAALYIQYLAEKMFISSFNNLESFIKLQDPL